MSALTPLLIAGAGGFAREVAQVVRAVNRQQPSFDVLGHVDDDAAKHGTVVDELQVLGPLSLVLDQPDALVVLATGRPGDYASRLRISERLGLPPERYATVVHPSASIAESVQVAPGCMVLAGVVATGGALIGGHVAVMPQSVITHDDVVEEFATLAAGVLLGGGVHVGRGAYLGSGVRVREHLHVGAWSLVGMGSIVTRAVPAGEVWYGAPARRQSSVTRADGMCV